MNKTYKFREKDGSISFSDFDCWQRAKEYARDFGIEYLGENI